MRTRYALLVLVFGAACGDDAECDPGFVLAGGVCVPGCPADQVLKDGVCSCPSNKVAQGDGCSCPKDWVDIGDTCVEPASEPFGATCTDAVGHSQCYSPAPYCAVQPTETEGYCTVTGCVEQPSVCPGGWECMDLGAFQDGLPSICLEPS